MMRRPQVTIRALLMAMLVGVWLWMVYLVWPSKTPAPQKFWGLAGMGIAFVWLWTIFHRLLPTTDRPSGDL